MQTAFLIYIRAVGLYMVVTLPVLIAPIMYFVSVIYVFIFGWFAWGLFSVIYLLCTQIKTYETKMLLLIPGVVISVAFAFHMLGVFNRDLDVWNSGGFMLFPITGVIAGWISLFMARKKISGAEETPEIINTGVSETLQ
ncbi:MAG TPA: hypothetical protein VF487_01595 [Chitinophagaceae bacterium]